MIAQNPFDVQLGDLWLPSRPLMTDPGIGGGVMNTDATIPAAQPVTPAASSNTKLKNLLSVIATESPTKVNDNVYSLVSISFTRNKHDDVFAGVRVWIKGYKGNNDFVLIGDGRESPLSFILETTQETVIVALQPYATDGTSIDLDSCLTSPVVLDGATSAPPSPTIAQNKVAIGTGIGWQFTFNYLTGLLADVIDGYWVYRSDVNVAPTPPNGRYKFVKQPATVIGSYVFQDITSSTYYYWVSSVNKAGLESDLVSVGDGSGGSVVGTTTQMWPSTYTVDLNGGHTSSSQAYDGNETTYAEAIADPYLTVAGEWGGWSAASGSPVGITLKVLVETVMEGKGVNCDDLSSQEESILEYSTDNGLTWSPFYEVEISTPADYYSVDLPAATDLTQVKVKGTAIGGSCYRVAIQDVFEIRIEVSY